MNKDELLKKHDDYTKNIDSWLFFKAAFDGTKALLDYGVVKRLTEEGDDDYRERKKTIFGFNLSERLISVIVSYLFSKPTDYDFSVLDNDKLFSMFRTDVNKQGDSLEVFMQDQLELSKIYGHVGILENKSKINGRRTINSDVSDRIYPYLTDFTPISIFDWKYDVVNGEKILTFLKLFDDLGRFNLWWEDRWEIWAQQEKDDYVLTDSGKNDLGYIPFTVLRNGNASGSMGGTSDIKEIARHDASLINMSHSANEIIKYNAFPMLQIPEPAEQDKKKKFKIAAAAVIYKSNRDPAIKAEWLATEVQAPINAIIEWNKVIILEAYKSVSASFMNDNGGSAESGEAKKRAFQSFNASLAKSATSLEKAELSIIKTWLDWQDKGDEMENISISRPKNFDVQSLADDIDNFTVASSMVKSETFNHKIQKTIVSKTLPELSSADVTEINKEIDAGTVVFDMDAADTANKELEADRVS